MAFTEQTTLISAVTATGVTTGSYVAVGERKRISIQFKATSITSGNGVFTIQVSNDGSTWTNYSRLTSNATNTNAQTDTRVASVTVSTNLTSGGTGGSIVFFPPGDHFEYLRAIVTVTTDGAYTATLHTLK